MSAPVSVFTGLAQDHSVLTDGAITPDILKAENPTAKLARRGRVIFHNDFAGGSFDGWRDHQGGNQQVPCLSLTQRRTHTGTHAAMLSTGHVTRQAALISNTASTYKNMSLYRSTGVVSMSAWLAHGGHAASGGAGADTAFYEWGLQLDVQKWDNSSRGFYKLVWQNAGDGTNPFLAIYNDANAPVKIAGTQTAAAGENESKLNFNYVRLTVDLDANGGLGGYLEAQMNDRVFDLAGLGAGRGATPPQAGASGASFAGGCNAGVGLVRSIAYPTLLQNILIFDDVVMTQGDVKA